MFDVKARIKRQMNVEKNMVSLMRIKVGSMTDKNLADITSFDCQPE
jgi:hypothetical protein